MESAQISPELETNIKANIEMEFIILSTYYVPTLRTIITTNIPGSPDPIFNDFKNHLDAFYSLSNHKKEINQEKKRHLGEWLDSNQRFSPKSVREAIKQFEEYSAELVKLGLIKIG